MTELKVLTKCYQCEEGLLIEVTDYISFLLHKYLLFMNIDYVCEDCAP